MAVIELGGSGGEREAFADHSHGGASSFNTNVGCKSGAFADHPHEGSSSFNTDTGGEEDTAALRQVPEAPVNDAKLSEVEKDAHAEVGHREYQSVLRFLRKLSDFPAEVQRPEMNEAGVTAKASDIMIALDAAMHSTFRVIKFTRIKLQALLADLEKPGVAIPDLSRLEIKPDVSTFNFEARIAIPEKQEPTDLEAVIAGIQKLEISIPVVEAKIADLKKLMDPIDLCNTQTVGRQEVESLISDVKAKIMAFEKLAVDLGVKMDEATWN